MSPFNSVVNSTKLYSFKTVIDNTLETFDASRIYGIILFSRCVLVLLGGEHGSLQYFILLDAGFAFCLLLANPSTVAVGSHIILYCIFPVMSAQYGHYRCYQY